jgi:hypothetical protein
MLALSRANLLEAPTMTPLPSEQSKESTSAEAQSSNTLKFSKMQLALAFVISDVLSDSQMKRPIRVPLTPCRPQYPGQT